MNGIYSTDTITKQQEMSYTISPQNGVQKYDSRVIWTLEFSYYDQKIVGVLFI